ncbi:hypothetical protein CHLRE_13g573650v5 [Chlamydomonas reinhardtii]|uniref:RRM domain-containing protein n=1 Tax=Chlamydomonas reinhardtii TaxID=3055 RepID=A0A2K3CZX1_CHLRE|nr:uncharacterized protein CHLRE_13g573650v5 [Chlamydomonas reinhardtii]PNW73811.1 hypothetical protein CHLRE_13g573650v5 [Chlamydomonas reinhardtii]
MSGRERGDYGPASSGVRNKVSVLVRNIPLHMTVDDLRKKFEKFGELRDVYIPRDYYTQRSRGFGFIEFRDARDADEAIYQLDKTSIDGREINVCLSKEGRKTPRDMMVIESKQNPGRSGGSSDRRRSRSRSPRGRGGRDRSRSRSPRGRGGHDYDRDRDPGRDYDRRDRDRDRDHDRRDRDRDRGRDYDRRDRDLDYDRRDRDRDRDYDRGGSRSGGRDRDREYDRDRGAGRDGARSPDRDRGRDRIYDDRRGADERERTPRGGSQERPRERVRDEDRERPRERSPELEWDAPRRRDGGDYDEARGGGPVGGGGGGVNVPQSAADLDVDPDLVALDHDF